jgi:hypothetical protein
VKANLLSDQIHGMIGSDPRDDRAGNLHPASEDHLAHGDEGHGGGLCVQNGRACLQGDGQAGTADRAARERRCDLDVVLTGGTGLRARLQGRFRAAFDVISTAHERTSLIVTTNLPFESWTEVLGSKRLTGATLDRLTHRCRIIETKGESYRLQDAKARTSRRAHPITKPIDETPIPS